MYKRIISLLIAVSFIVTMGFGCKGLSQEEQVAVRPITLNYWTVYNDTDQLNAFVNTYKQLKPHININIRRVRSDEFDTLFLNALADDISPDIISVNVRDIRKYQDRLATMPSEVVVPRMYVQGEYFKENVIVEETRSLPSASAIKSNFVGTVYDDVVIQNQIFGLPLALDTLALYYNKDLLDQVGVPEPPSTWDEFMEDIKKSVRLRPDGSILQSGIALGTGNNIERAFDILSLFMLQSGVEIAQGPFATFAGGLDQRPDLTHPTLSALRFYTDFAQPTKEVYTWNEKMEDALQNFVRGKSVFYIGFAYDYPRIKSQGRQMNLEIVPIPQLNPDKPVNVVNYWIESVPRKSKNQQEAWDFIGFMTEPDNIKKYTEATMSPTPLRSQIVEQQKNLILAPFVTNILQSRNWYLGRNSVATEQAFKQLIHDYLQPVPDNQKAVEYYANLVIRAAQVIQQTM